MRSKLPFSLAHIACFTFAALSASLVSGCGPDNNADTKAPGSGGNAATTAGGTSNGAPPSTPAGNFKVALVMSGPTSDNGWNAGAYSALQAVQKDLGLGKDDIAYIDNQTSADKQAASLREYAAKNFNVVIGHGNEYQDVAKSLEAKFPKTTFIVSSSDFVGKNTTPIVLQLEDGAYLEGMLAAGMSKTGKIGEVGAEKIPPVASVFTAFEKGAKAVNPKIIVLPAVYTNSWDDPNKAKGATLPLIDQGADVIMQDVDAAAQGVFNAVQSRNKADKPVYALGTNKDQNEQAPDVILASAPINIDKAFIAICKQVKEGTFKPSATPWDMKSGVIGFVLNPKLEAKIDPKLKQQIQDTQKKILDGTFSVMK